MSGSKDYFFSWRHPSTAHHLPRTVDQGETSSCCMVATAACCFSRSSISGNPVPISSQYIINELPKTHPGFIERHVCRVGKYEQKHHKLSAYTTESDYCFAFINERGVVHEDLLGYVGSETNDEVDPNAPRWGIPGFEVLGVSEETDYVGSHRRFTKTKKGGGDVVEEAIRMGPIVGEAGLYDSFLTWNRPDHPHYRRNRIYRSNNGKAKGDGPANYFDHALHVTGFGRRGKTLFFECQGSHGLDWGDDGYCYIARGEFFKFSYPTGPLELREKRRAVHVWIFSESTQELLLQRRADCKDSWSAGHISAGDSSLISARRELREELGVILPKDAFELIFIYLQECIGFSKFNDVYLVTTIAPILLEAFTLQESQVSAVKYIPLEEYKTLLATEDPEYVPCDVNGQYGQLFDIIATRYKVNTETQSLALQKQLSRYACISLGAELTGLTDGDKEALSLLVKAGTIIDDIFHEQAWYSNPTLRDWLKQQAETCDVDKLKWMYYRINKSPWSCLDKNESFLTTADSAVKLLPAATKAIPGWEGLEYRTAFPLQKPPGANFYPPDMDKMEFELWKDSLAEDKKQDAKGLFSIIKRHSETNLDTFLSDMSGSMDQYPSLAHDLYTVPYSQEYKHFLAKAAELLHKAGDLTSSPSLKRLLHSKTNAFISNDYYDSDIAWMELDSKLDVTIGPYETYDDALFGYKAMFETFIGVRDDKATAQVKLFGNQLQALEQNLPMDNMYKSQDIIAAPIRVIQLIYNSGDVKGPQSVAFSLPNDETIVRDRGTSIVVLKNVSEAKFKHILRPIAEACITKEQQDCVNFNSFFTHTICRECCRGIGPHSITLPSGEKSTVKLKLQELHSALEEAKADIVGLWALKYLIGQNLLPKSLTKSMHVSFLAGCFRLVRFGLEEAHGKGQALQFNWLFEKGAFVLHPDETFSVNFSKVDAEVESLSREILTIQAKGDKKAAKALLDKYCKMSHPLKVALEKLEKIQVPVDIAPTFPIADEILQADK